MKYVSRRAAEFVFCVLLLGAVGLTPLPARAQGPTPSIDDQVTAIAKDLYCPVCSGVSLDVCETQACIQWRELIREKVTAGETKQQIQSDFVAQYGDRVLGAPPAEGFNLSAYLLPALVFIVGAVVVGLTARSWLKRPAAQPVPASEPQISGETAERIARELKARE